MSIVIDVILFVSLLVIAIQDFKFRAISWLLLPVVFLAFLYRSFSFAPGHEIFKNTLFNIGFVILQILFLTLYFTLKHRRFVNIIDSYIGLGDVCFFIAICVAFNPINYIVFFINSILATIILFLLYNIIFKKTVKEIPLAGAQSIGMISLLVVNIFFSSFDYYSTEYFISFFN